MPCKTLTAALVLVAQGVMAATLRVVESGDGFSVRRGTETVVSVSKVVLGGREPASLKRTFREDAVTGKVWNVWCEERDGRHRLEVVERADGVVEITLAGEVRPNDGRRARILQLYVPDSFFRGRAWQGLRGDGRSWQPVSGTFDANFSKDRLRWMAVNGLTFDFNPLGAADFCSSYTVGAVNGVWTVERLGSGYRLYAGGVMGAFYGGFGGAKLVIREGAFEDYDRIHFIRDFRYQQHLKSSCLLSFGSERHGGCYSDGHHAYSSAEQCGWMGRMPEKTIRGYKEGALYSGVVGRNGHYRFSGLRNGFYIVTVGSGNWTGVGNCFSVSANGTKLADRVSVRRRTARQFSRAVHVGDGVADIRLDGDFVVSTIGVQPVLADEEDYSVNRSFWRTEGYEACSIYRSDEQSARPRFEPSDETYELPVPGEETSAVWRDPPSPTLLPDSSLPSLAWLAKGRMTRVLQGANTLAELDDPGDLEQYLRQEVDGKGYLAAIVSGMHSRHTYETHLVRGQEALRRMASALHKRGLKLIDHHDATLLWNVDVGLRVLMERVPELIRSRADGLPSFQLCPCNRVFCEKYYAYLRSLVEAGVDGFQLDEVEFWEHGCVCSACRDRFFRETGWRLPMNECDRDFNDPNSVLRKRWHGWRVRTVTNWFVELRRRLMDIKPDLVLNMYTTHWGFTSSLPRRGGSSDLFDLGRTINYFGTEVMTRNVMAAARSLPPLRKSKLLLKKNYGTPVWSWYYSGNRKVDYFAWCLAVMNGQTPLLSDSLPEDGSVPDYVGFGASPLAMDVAGAEQIAEVALLFSFNSRDWNQNRDFSGELFGTAQELEALHVPYEFIAERNLTDACLGKYKVLFVGTAQCLSDDDVQAIRRYAERGGTVCLSSGAATRDEIGQDRSRWPFEDVFGFDPRRTDLSEETVRTLGRGCISYNPMAEGEEFNCPEFQVGRTYRFDPDPQREQAFRKRLLRKVGAASVWKTSAPAGVFTSLWKERNGSIAVHVLNATGCRLTAGVPISVAAPDPAFPALDEDIVFSMEVRNVGRVVAQSPDFGGVRDLAFRTDGGGLIEVTIPRSLVKAYMLVRVLQKEGEK